MIKLSFIATLEREPMIALNEIIKAFDSIIAAIKEKNDQPAALKAALMKWMEWFLKPLVHFKSGWNDFKPFVPL